MARSITLPAKICAHCGLTFTWRKKWERSWEWVHYCSDRCRRESKARIHKRYEEEILRCLDARGPGKSLCPSEIARMVHSEDWRHAMEPVRCAARRLVRQGLIEIWQGGKAVSIDAFKGPIRLRKR